MPLADTNEDVSTEQRIVLYDHRQSNVEPTYRESLNLHHVARVLPLYPFTISLFGVTSPSPFKTFDFYPPLTCGRYTILTSPMVRKQNVTKLSSFTLLETYVPRPLPSIIDGRTLTDLTTDRHDRIKDIDG